MEDKRNTSKEKKKKNKGYPYKQLNKRDKEKCKNQKTNN